MKYHLIIGSCLILLSSCIGDKQSTKKVEVIYCPEINNKNSFNIPKDITNVFKSKNVDGVNYEVISDSKIKIISQDFDNPVEVPIFNSVSQTIFGTPNQKKTNELIENELHTIKFDKKNSRKTYPDEPSENQIFIYYNTKNINKVIGRKYYVNSSEKISNVIFKFISSKKILYIFNSQPLIIQTKNPQPPVVRNTKISVLQNSKPIYLQAFKSSGCYLKWFNINGEVISPKISTNRTGKFRYYVSQQNIGTKLESKKIEIVVEILEKKPADKSIAVLREFPKSTLGINKSSDGKLLVWNSPIPKKENKTIKYILTFYDLDNNRSILHQETITNICYYDISTLRNKFPNGERPKNGIDVMIKANCEEYRSLEDNRHLSLNNSLKIYNCY